MFILTAVGTRVVTINKSWEKAFGWYTEAAKYNLGGAQHFIGYMYQNGLGSKEDYILAMEWYKKQRKIDTGTVLLVSGVCMVHA